MEESLHQEFFAIEQTHWWFQGRRQVVAAAIGPHLRAVGTGRCRIFDVGCGNGEMLDMLRVFGSVTGLDPSPGAVDHCRQRFGGEVTVRVGALPDDLPPPGSVDVVTAFDVLEHLDDDRAALGQIFEVLPAGGLLILSVPALQLLWGGQDVVSHHRRRYRRPQLARRIEEAGFSIVRLTYFNSWMFPAVAAVRILRRLARGECPPAAKSDFALPPPWLNRLLLSIFASERRVITHRSLPIGVSILAVARKPSGDRTT